MGLLLEDVAAEGGVMMVDLSEQVLVDPVEGWMKTQLIPQYHPQES
jgi:hypothetical protein